MQLSRKFSKIVEAESYQSIWRGIGRALHPQSVEKFIRHIDPTLMPALAARHACALQPGQNWTKYFDAGRWLRLNIRRAQDIGLDRCHRPLRVLDLGSGAGYFLFVCKHLGHDGMGLDVPEPAFYGEMFEQLGLARVVAPVEARQRLPEALRARGPFDLVTAFSIEFNKYRVDGRWSATEWSFLLDDLRDRFLRPGGRIYFDLNPNYGGEFMTPEIRAMFLRRGARIDRRSKLLFDPVR